MTDVDNNKLHFNRKFQAGLVTQLILDYDFFRNVSDDLSPAHIDTSQACINLLKVIKAVHAGLKRPMTVDIIRNNVLKLAGVGAFSEAEVAGITSVLDMGLTLTPVEAAVVKRDAFEFLRKQTIAKAVGESIGHLDAGRLDTVYEVITNAYKKSFGIGESIGYNYNEESVAARYLEPPRSNVWSSGYPKLDNYLDGGFAESECYSVISPTGRGKTALLCNFNVTALEQGKKCLFASLEMRDRQISQRQDSILAGFSNSEIAMNRDFQKILSDKIDGLTGMSYVKEFPRGQLSMSAFRVYLDRFCNEVWKPDVIILDWLGCLKLPYSKDAKKHELLAEAADDFINLTRDYKCTGITAHQSNRSAVSQDIFDYSAVSESFASLFGMDLVLGLGASNEAKDAGKRTLSILKSRMGPDSVFVKLIGDLPGQPLTFKFKEAADEAEEKDLLQEQQDSV